MMNSVRMLRKLMAWIWGIWGIQVSARADKPAATGQDQAGEGRTSGSLTSQIKAALPSHA